MAPAGGETPFRRRKRAFSRPKTLSRDWEWGFPGGERPLARAERGFVGLGNGFSAGGMGFP
jgi:hypothetical protein